MTYGDSKKLAVGNKSHFEANMAFRAKRSRNMRRSTLKAADKDGKNDREELDFNGQRCGVIEPGAFSEIKTRAPMRSPRSV